MNETRSSLLSRVRDFGDEAGWDEFYKLYRPLLIRYARRRGLGTQDAEEIAHACIEVVVSRIQDFQKQKSFRGWLHRIVDYKVKQHLEGRRRQRLVSDPAALDDVQDAGPSPAELWERHWNRTHLLYCLASLRGELADHTLAAFERYVLDEVPVKKIAEDLALTPNQIYVAKNRVMKRLRERFEDLIDGMYGVIQ